MIPIAHLTMMHDVCSKRESNENQERWTRMVSDRFVLMRSGEWERRKVLKSVMGALPRNSDPFVKGVFREGVFL